MAFHVEVRQFPHVARAFNLTAEQLHERVVGRWVRDQMIELDERRWAPERAKLKIYDAPPLGPAELGLGRGWANVTRAGEDVTEEVLADAERAARSGGSAAESRAAEAVQAVQGAQAAAAARGAQAAEAAEAAPAAPAAGAAPPAAWVAALKRRLLEELTRGPVELSRVPELSGDLPPGSRASQRLAVAEQAVWELLHEGTARASDETGLIPPARWESVLLAWNSWGCVLKVLLQRASD